MILGCEVSFESVDAAQVNFTACDHVEENWETPCGARCADALAGRRFGHVVPRY